MESKEPVNRGEKPATPVCSVIVPTRDKLNFLKPCIESILASEDANSIEIVIVDNESIEIGRELSQGSYGGVYEACQTTAFAMKTMMGTLMIRFPLL